MFSYPGGFVIYGGKLKDGSLSSELWLYEVVGGRWTLRAADSPIHPPALARHTITLANDGWIYLVGGATEQGQFSSKVFKIKLNTGENKCIFVLCVLRASSVLVYSLAGEIFGRMRIVLAILVRVLSTHV